MCGKKFVSMMSSHHCQYQGNAFFQNKDELHTIYVDSRIVIDADLFRKSNPNYPRLQNQTAPLDGLVIDVWGNIVHSSEPNRVISNGTKPSEMKKEDLIICCPTLLGFSLGAKFWGETLHLR
jgi:hypothetical protein